MSFKTYHALKFSEEGQASAIADAFSELMRQSVSESKIAEIIDADKTHPAARNGIATGAELVLDGHTLADLMGGAFLAILGRSFIAGVEDDGNLAERALKIAAERGYYPEVEEDEPTADEIALLQSAGRVDPLRVCVYDLGVLTADKLDEFLERDDLPEPFKSAIRNNIPETLAKIQSEKGGKSVGEMVDEIAAVTKADFDHLLNRKK